MPWLVVLGEGSWSHTSGRTWVPDERRQPPVDAPNGERGYWKYDSQRFMSGVHEIDDATAAAALKTGLQHLVVCNEKPVLVPSQEHGTLTKDDIRIGVPSGAILAHEPVEPEEVPDPEAPPMIFDCSWCARKFPSKAALDRHIEFEHTVVHEVVQEQEKSEAIAAMEERAALRRMEESDPKTLHPADRENVIPIDSVGDGSRIA